MFTPPNIPTFEDRSSIRIQENADTFQIQETPQSNCCVCKCVKELIPLKAALFFWFGGVASVGVSLGYILVEKGLNSSHISYMPVYISWTLTIGLVVSGLIVDKTGNAKPVMIGNLLLSLLLVNSFLLIPDVKDQITFEKTSLNDEDQAPTTRAMSTYEENQHDLAQYDNHGFFSVMCYILFVLYMGATVVSLRMFDAIAMSMATAYNSDYGLQMAWAFMGSLVFSISGIFILVFTGGNYNAGIYLYDSVTLLTMFLVWKLDIRIQSPMKKILQNMWILVKNPDVFSFWLAMLILGTCLNFSSSQFAEDYLISIGCNTRIILLFSLVIAIPFLFSAKFWIRKIGNGNIIILAFAAHAVFYLGYVYLIEPWWALAIEITKIFSNYLLWVAAVQYSHSIAPSSMTTTVIAISGALHYGVSKSTTTILEASIVRPYGERFAFKAMATFAIVAGILFVFYRFLRHKSSTNQEVITTKIERREEEPKTEPEELDIECETVEELDIECKTVEELETALGIEEF